MLPMPPGQTLDNTLGSLYVGSLCSAVLYGVTSIQTYAYYHWFYKRDSWVHRIAVGLLWSLDTIHFILVVHGVYYYCVESFENPLKLLTLVWSMKLQIVINVVVILLVQGLYAYRVWLLGGYHNRILAWIVVFITAGGFAVGMALAHAVYTLTFVSDHVRISWAIIASLATATFVDFFIAGAMVYYLRRSRGLQQRVNSKISTMMQMSLTSGILTSACSTAALITYVALPKTLIFMGIESFLTKLYINSFLAMLNARERHHDLAPHHSEHHSSHTHSSRLGVSVHIHSLSRPGGISTATTASKSDSSNPRTSLSLYKSSLAPVSPLESQMELTSLADFSDAHDGHRKGRDVLDIKHSDEGGYTDADGDGEGEGARRGKDGDKDKVYSW
ncbi:hypothetical protein PLEOSDRAFT_1095146 [Pleurotus ostreatus PC15]|uniref:DUF6534 domain-containing protein n=1 Tax=Pleurotus ostreatus (strain PC15) TaxID=1137138 RepID=A0A067P7T1_PLEO1|nr:hypothetical protein PLEOSDRAFT_1095146 [Pleurotus ostreatus PC15]